MYNLNMPRRKDGHELTVRSSHSPGEAARNRVANVLFGAHPATRHGEKTGDDAAHDLEQDGKSVTVCCCSQCTWTVLTTAAMACCGVRPNASSVLPTVHAEMLEPDTVQYAVKT